MPNIFPDIKQDNDSTLMENVQKTMRKKLQQQSDIEKTRDELIKFKITYNKTIKEMKLLRIEHSKLQVNMKILFLFIILGRTKQNAAGFRDYPHRPKD